METRNMPDHIGIIMDGNGRWAQKRNLPRGYGHKEGAMRVLDIVKACYKKDIPYLSLYAFSTENWKRPAEEVQHLMALLQKFIAKYIAEMHENGIRLNVMGDIEALPEKVRESVQGALQTTADNSKMVLNIGLNYGGQDEILRAAKSLAKDVEAGKIDADAIDKEAFESRLYTAGAPPLDLLIRPSGELRVSNFMLYQLAYSEFWFSDVLWPDFTPEVLDVALRDYQNRNRRFGGI